MQDKCAIRGTCGSKGIFGPQLPCPYDGPPEKAGDDGFTKLLTDVCGPDIASEPVCCTKEQVETLQSNFQQAEPIISSCPACRNNFREFYCSFTCSPHQAEFIRVTETQETNTGETAVKTLEFQVSERLGQGFFNSCKDVKFSATNGYAMDFIGGGAKNYSAFLQYMGDERPGLGSPFQINFPEPTGVPALDYGSRSCADEDLGSRCACVDCPSVCTVLPDYPPAGSQTVCSIGTVSCLTFIAIVVYSACVAALLSTYGLIAWRRRKKRTYERLALSADSASIVGSVGERRAGLVGASSLATRDGEESSGGLSDVRNLGRGNSLIEPVDALRPRHYRLSIAIRRFFHRLGFLCASYPWLTLALASLTVGLLNLGWVRFSVEVDPVRLWVSPTSDTKLQKEFFDQHFGPFYRTQQLFVYLPDGQSDGSGPSVLSWDRLRWLGDLQDQIRELRSDTNGYTLEDVCFKPAGPDGACVIQSITAWFGDDVGGSDPDTWEDQIIACASNPTVCLPEYGQPLGPQYILGGVPTSDSRRRWLDANALVVTYVVSDSLDLTARAKAEEWERSLRAFLMDVSRSSLNEAGALVAFSTGVSLEEELNQSTNTDVKIVVLSYLVMFFYIALTLGNNRSGQTANGRGFSAFVSHLPFVSRQNSSPNDLGSDRPVTLFPKARSLLIKSKVLLGLFAIILVLVSISTSVGFFSFLGVKVTLIIAEVIPFLVLAVGVDNVFILVHELDRQNSLHGPAAVLSSQQESTDPISPTTYPTPFEPNQSGDDADSMQRGLSPEERVAKTLAKMGPSILLSTVTETIAFSLGALVPMPAVRNFALYAAGSVFMGALLQVTALVAALTLDLRREEASRVDCFPCVRLAVPIALPPDNPLPPQSLLTKFMKKYYAPFILRDSVKAIIIVFFAGVSVLSIISIQHIQLGLDQRLALPSSSYLVPYFNAVDDFLNIGPPVYFVSTDNNATDRSGQRHLCGRFTTCDDFSLMNTLEGERKRPESSYLAEPAASWFDDFFLWLDPRIDSCCRVRRREPEVFCSPHDSDRLCRPCFEDRVPEWNITLYGMPEGEEFLRYLRQWLISPTDENCPLGGRAAYSSALSVTDSAVDASHFRTFHIPLKSQKDYINAYAAANRIAAEISESTGTQVFPYSIFYVFFEQYLHIINITQEILGLGLASVLLVTTLLLGSWRTGIIVTTVVALTVVNIMGVMGIWGISLNALSLVNLVISLGIAVEFCSHIARAFMSAGISVSTEHANSYKEKNERVWTALAEVGPSVVSGITFTKLIGISVLALTRSKLLEIYYFRMWLTLIVSGALHGLVLLPVILSLAGGPGFTEIDADEEWMTSAIRKHDQEYAPFRTDSEFGDSD